MTAKTKDAAASVGPRGSDPTVSDLKKGEHLLKIVRRQSDGGGDSERDELDVSGKPTGRRLPPTEAEEVGPDGKMTGKTVLVGERFYVDVEYPDGFVKQHHVKAPEDLVARAKSVMAARYHDTPEDAIAVSAPASLDEGEEFKVTVG